VNDGTASNEVTATYPETTITLADHVWGEAVAAIREHGTSYREGIADSIQWKLDHKDPDPSAGFRLLVARDIFHALERHTGIGLPWEEASTAYHLACIEAAQRAMDRLGVKAE
jgi:hypothetical protein